MFSPSIICPPSELLFEEAINWILSSIARRSLFKFDLFSLFSSINSSSFWSISSPFLTEILLELKSFYELYIIKTYSPDPMSTSIIICPFSNTPARVFLSSLYFFKLPLWLVFSLKGIDFVCLPVYDMGFPRLKVQSIQSKFGTELRMNNLLFIFSLLLLFYIVCDTHSVYWFIIPNYAFSRWGNI